PAVNGSLKEIQAISARGNKDSLQQILNSKYISHLDFRLFKEVRCLNALDSLLYNSSLTHILWGNGPLPVYLPIGLKHLYVYPEYCNDLRKPIAVKNISLMPHLISLSAPLCVFLQNEKNVSKNYGKFVKNFTAPAEKRNDTNLATTYKSNDHRITDKNEDQGLERHHFQTSVIKPQDSSLLAQFALRTPNLKTLEIKDCIRLCNQMTSLEDLGSLRYISYWTKLECLFLASLPAELSSSLIQIGLCCPKLQRLGLHFIGPNSHLDHCIIRDVVDMVTTLTQLKDFRFCSRSLVLWAQIDGQAKIFKENFPKIHYEEMINPAQIKIVPPVEE
ncbi:Protein of unknown function, partial [Gryllus bimaculatus]